MRTAFIFIFWMLLLFPFDIKGSNDSFIHQGKLTYIRKINAYRITEKEWLNRYYKDQKFYSDTIVMDFDSTASLWQNLHPADQNWIQLVPSSTNEIYRDFGSDSVYCHRSLFEEDYYFKDSTHRIAWKFYDEIRMIAGFECYKAVGIIRDSIYVVAFFCPSILPPGGPEQFGGLPGMILGLAIPRYHLTYFAVSYSAEKNAPVKPKPGRKKKYLDGQVFQSLVTDKFKDWGPFGYRYIHLWTL